jgi:hypothetical protein
MAESIIGRSPWLGMVKRYAVLAYGAFGTMADVGLLVLGSLLVGLSLSVLLAGFGLVDVVPEEISTGPMLVSALVLAVAGLFCLGLASEGPLGRGRRLVGFKLWEVGIGRIIAVVLVGFIAYFAHRLLEGVIEGLPLPLLKGAAGLRTVGVAGMTAMPLIGVPLAMLLRGAPVEHEWVHRADVPALFVVWAVATLILL